MHNNRGFWYHGERKYEEAIAEFQEAIPDALEVLGGHCRRMLDGEADPAKLVLTRRISRELSHYRQFNDQVAALRQLRDHGAELHPGQKIRYIVRDSNSKHYMTRVALPQFADARFRRHRR